MKRIFMLCCLLVSISGCLPEESPVTPYPRGNTKTGTASMGSNYANQVFIDLGVDSAVFTRKWDTWDLELESAPGGWHIRLNGAKTMLAANTNLTDFSPMPKHDSLSFFADAPHGNIDSTAIGVWCEISGDNFTSKKQVYVIDRGSNAIGKSYGKIKFQVLGVTGTSYTFRYSKLDGTNEQTVTVSKDPVAIKTLFSFDTGGAITTPQPDDNSWDIVFTKYTHVFYEATTGYTPYSVTGTLINTASGVTVAIDTIPFAEVTTEKISSYMFSSNEDAIGYDWKVYDLNAGSYTVNTKIIYIIRDRKGFYWKLHFLDFYDDKGDRGTPKYEFQKI